MQCMTLNRWKKLHSTTISIASTLLKSANANHQIVEALLFQNPMQNQHPKSNANAKANSNQKQIRQQFQKRKWRFPKQVDVQLHLNGGKI